MGGTEQSEAVQFLLGLRDAAFDNSDEKLALALRALERRDC